MSHTLSMVAHPDDDLIFLNPDILSDIRAGHRVWVAYLTAGNLEPGPAGMDYADKRIQGVRAAYAKSANVVNDWSYQAISVGGRTLATNYLKAAPQVRLVFTYVHAAAGADQVGDLARMWADPSFVAAPIDGRPSYTKDQFASMLRALADHVAPDFLRGHDPQGQQCGDNVDHDRAGKFTCLSNLDPTGRMVRRLDSYFGYVGRSWVENVSAYWAAEKLAVWRTYKPHDPAFANSPTGWDEMAARQYQRHIWQPGDTWTPL